MKEVVLHGKVAAGRVALVDDEDFELVSRYRWYVNESHQASGTVNRSYAETNIGRKEGRCLKIKMHKLLTGWPETDHEDHNGLNNQRFNLRPATRVQNNGNMRPQAGKTSMYKGICWDRRRGKWRAMIGINDRRFHIGYYTNEVCAAVAYDVTAYESFGEFAYLNRDHFPELTVRASQLADIVRKIRSGSI